MPADTNNTQSHSASQNKNKLSLQQLARTVKYNAAREPEDSIADFRSTEKACRLCFSKLLTQDSSNLSNNALADFLDVLSSAESYRLTISAHAETALYVWHDYYIKEEPEQALSKKEALGLEEIVTSRDEWRKVYMKIVKKTVAQDLYNLFISNPWSISDFMVRLLEYNPETFEPTSGYEPCPRNFLQFLSPHEKAALKRTCRASLQFVQESHKWLKQNFPEDILGGLHSQKFQATHPPPTNLMRLQSLLDYHLGYISRIYATVTTMFPSQINQS